MVPKILLPLALVVAAPFVIAAGGGVEPSDLAILKSAKPGLWQHSFTTIPANPAAPARTEKGCVSQAMLTEMINQLKAPTGSDAICDIEMKSDFATRAEGVMHCPPIEIAQLGIKAPGADMPILFEKSGNEEHWVVTVKTPAVPGVTPAATWRHDYRRLGQCPG